MRHLAEPTARNAPPAVRRLVNDEILEISTRLDDGSAMFEFICECGDLRCRAFAKMTLADYRASTPGSVVGHR
jgi:hypothetical protein